MFLFPSALQKNYVSKQDNRNKHQNDVLWAKPKYLFGIRSVSSREFYTQLQSSFPILWSHTIRMLFSGKGIEHEVEDVCACKQFTIFPLFGSGMREFLNCKTCSSWRQDDNSFLCVLNVTRSAEKKVTVYLHISFEGLESGSCDGVEIV